jgi:hypothetical protein
VVEKEGVGFSMIARFYGLGAETDLEPCLQNYPNDIGAQYACSLRNINRQTAWVEGQQAQYGIQSGGVWSATGTSTPPAGLPANIADSGNAGSTNIVTTPLNQITQVANPTIPIVPVVPVLRYIPDTSTPLLYVPPTSTTNTNTTSGAGAQSGTQPEAGSGNNTQQTSGTANGTATGIVSWLEETFAVAGYNIPYWAVGVAGLGLAFMFMNKGRR